MSKNIIFYFSDQQRWDTVNEELMPNLMSLAADGINYTNCFTCQPVCGPARACLQTGVYATQNGCYVNGIPLPERPELPLLTSYLHEAGYETAYVGKWHLASDRLPFTGFHCEKTAVPREKQGGYDYWRAADVLEFTSHGYDGYVFDGEGNRIDFEGYRADCINDFALEFLENRDPDRPFFLFVSQLEPHHQNDRNCYEGYRPTVAQYRDYPIPPDLAFLPGDYAKEYPDYLSAINRLDYNVGRLTEKLKALDLFDDTVIIYTSDHGSHFKTRNMEYKRSCHDACTHIPLVVRGGAFRGGTADERLVSLIDLPATILGAAGIDVPGHYMGHDLAKPEPQRECLLIQISESQVGRAIRTQRYKYAVRAPKDGYTAKASRLYVEDYLYDLQLDPHETQNLVRSRVHAHVRAQLRNMLLAQLSAAGEARPVIVPALRARKQ